MTPLILTILFLSGCGPLTPIVWGATKTCSMEIVNYRTGQESTYSIPFEEFDTEEAAHLFAGGMNLPDAWVHKHSYSQSEKVTWDVYLQEPPPGDFQCFYVEED